MPFKASKKLLILHNSIIGLLMIVSLIACVRRPSSSALVQVTPSSTPIEEIRVSNPKEFRLISGKAQLVMFLAYWCGDSRTMYPILKRLEAEYFQRINFYYLDIDDPANTAIKNQLGYRLQPEIYFVDSAGNVLKNWQGVVSLTVVESAFKSVLK